MFPFSFEVGDVPPDLAGVVVACMRPPAKSGIIVIFDSPGLVIEGKIEKSGRRGLSLIARRIYPLTAKRRNTALASDPADYPEHKRTIGCRSWVKGQGV